MLFIILLGPSKNQVIRRRTVLHLEEHMQSKSGIRISTCRIRTGDHAVRRQTFYPTGLSDTTDRKRCTMTHPARPLLPRTHAGTIMLASFGYGVEWCGINDQAYLLLGFIQMEERGSFIFADALRAGEGSRRGRIKQMSIVIVPILLWGVLPMNYCVVRQGILRKIVIPSTGLLQTAA